jgi:Family of unknown function (DUF6290)
MVAELARPARAGLVCCRCALCTGVTELARRPGVGGRHGPRGINESLYGITRDTMACMAMTLRLADDETEALRRRAELEQRSMQEVARQAIREYVENHSRAQLLDQVLDEELPRYAEALERLGQ